MIRTVFTTIGFALCASAAFAQAPAATTPPDKPATVNERIENQRDRIAAGTNDDQLTRGERTRLRADDAAIRAQERVYRRTNDGTLTKGERKQLNRELNRNSRRIYRDRHNNPKPK